MSTQRQKVVLMLIGMLVILKWFALPALAQIEEKLASKALVDRSISKIEQLLEQEQQWLQVEGQALEARQRAFGGIAVYDSPSSFQLVAQQQLEALLAEYHLSIVRFNWQQPKLVLDQAGIYRQRAMMNLNGDTYQLLLLMARLESMDPLYKSSTLFMDILPESGLGPMTASVGVDAMYMLREQSN